MEQRSGHIKQRFERTERRCAHAVERRLVARNIVSVRVAAEVGPFL